LKWRFNQTYGKCYKLTNELNNIIQKENDLNTKDIQDKKHNIHNIIDTINKTSTSIDEALEKKQGRLNKEGIVVATLPTICCIGYIALGFSLAYLNLNKTIQETQQQLQEAEKRLELFINDGLCQVGDRNYFEQRNYY